MKNYAILPILLILSISMISTDDVYGQVDLLSDILFLQTGEISTAESQFQISSEWRLESFLVGI